MSDTVDVFGDTIFHGPRDGGVVSAQEAGFFSFLQTASLAAIDSFVGRQQVRVEQPTMLAAVMPTRPAISTNTLIAGAAIVGVAIFALSR